MGKVDLVQFESAGALAEGAAQEWLRFISPSKAHYAAFSGGRIAESFFDAIGAASLRRRLPLANVHFFWADERCVPPEHANSNYRIMHARLLQPLGVPETHVHRIRGELGPEVAAQDASRQFAQVVPGALDFVFLGMGEDGHIASIFPGDPLTETKGQYYRPIKSAPKPPPERVTLAMHAMVSARQVSVLVSGAGKEPALGKTLRGGSTPLGWLVERRDLTRIFTDIGPK